MSNYGVSGTTLLKKGNYPYWNTTVFRGIHTVWTVMEQVAVNDGSAVRVTNTVSSLARFYRLWQP